MTRPARTVTALTVESKAGATVRAGFGVHDTKPDTITVSVTIEARPVEASAITAEILEALA